MKLSTILFTSLLGISSVASASPSIDFHAQGSIHIGTPAPVVVVRDHRTAPLPSPVYYQPVRNPDPRPFAPPMAPSAWVKLGTVSTGTQSLRLDPATTRLDRLLVEANGRVQLKQVTIMFANGGSQVVKLDRTMITGNRAVVDLKGSNRDITRIIVSSRWSQRGSITLRGHDDAAASPWAKLGSLTTGKQTLALDSSRNYDRIALTATGSVHMVKAVIRFGNGTEQIVALDATMTSDMRGKVIDLTGNDRLISSVTLVSDARDHGRITVFAI